MLCLLLSYKARSYYKHSVDSANNTEGIKVKTGWIPPPPPSNVGYAQIQKQPWHFTDCLRRADLYFCIVYVLPWLMARKGIVQLIAPWRCTKSYFVCDITPIVCQGKGFQHSLVCQHLMYRAYKKINFVLSSKQYELCLCLKLLLKWTDLSFHFPR